MNSLISDTISPLYVAAGAGTTLSLYLLGKYWASKSRLPYPPGPRPLPLIGNLLDVPTSRFALTWAKLAEQYGPLTFLSVPGQHILVISTIEEAKNILDKRGAIYMNRPRFIMAGELMGFEDTTSLSQYTPTWKKHRALMKQSFSPTAVRRDYSKLLTKKAREYVGHLLANPENFLSDLQKVIAQNLLELTYGRTSDEEGLDYVQLNKYIVDVAVRAMQGYLVDFVPALQYLPSWFPGMKFKRDAMRWKKEVADARDTTFARAKKSVITGDADHVSSYMLNNLRDLYRRYEESPSVEKAALEEEEAAISLTGFSFFMAGTDTLQITIHGLILAMILFPSVQEKVQEEIDRVVGRDRAPSFDDQPNMPYLQALVLETLRWTHPGPSGFPHSSLSDDVYNGYFIPKGTTVIYNTWSITRGPRYYTDPTTFNPDRHIGPNRELDPLEYAFGYGRRVCPGRELALQTLWIMVASILWAFKLERDLDDTTPLDNDADRWNFESLSSPVAFKCHITPRPGAENLKMKLVQ